MILIILHNCPQLGQLRLLSPSPRPLCPAWGESPGSLASDFLAQSSSFSSHYSQSLHPGLWLAGCEVDVLSTSSTRDIIRLNSENIWFGQFFFLLNKIYHFYLIKVFYVTFCQTNFVTIMFTVLHSFTLQTLVPGLTFTNCLGLYYD